MNNRRNRRNRYTRPLIAKIQAQPSTATAETKWDRRFKFLTRFELIIGLIAIPIIAIIGWNEIEAMAGQRRVNAWQLVTNPAPGNSGKISALEYLNQDHYCLPLTHFCLMQKESFTGIDLTATKDQSGVYLYQVDLIGADLSKAKLSKAYLAKARLKRANLIDANLIEAGLTEANLTEADLTGANLTNANLSLADLREADLYDANLTKADLAGANLTGADLRNTDLTGAILIRATPRWQPLATPTQIEAIVSQARIDTACQRPSAKAPLLPRGLKWHGRICKRYIDQ